MKQELAEIKIGNHNVSDIVLRRVTLISNGQQSIKRNILAQCKASNYLQMTQPFLT